MKRLARLRLVGLLVVAVSGVGVLAGSSGAAPSGGCVTSAGMATCTFSFTGAAESWTVPAGVSSATFDVFGAKGGAAGAQGGKGAEVKATISVTPGETLHVVVGGAGGKSSGPGGFNGGG